MSAALLSRPRAIVGGASAAHLHGFSGFGQRQPVIIVPWSGNARSPISRVIRSSFFATTATMRIRGFEATTPAETILTLSADFGGNRLEGIVDDCLLTGRVRVEDFEPIFDRIYGARVAGSGRLRRLIEERQPHELGVDSTYLERLLERVLADDRIPRWIREHPTSINGRAGRVDVFIPSWSLVAEADSRRWHARQADFEIDRQRDNELATRGIQVLRFSYRMLKDSPEACLATILDVGTHRRAPRPG